MLGQEWAVNTLMTMADSNARQGASAVRKAIVKNTQRIRGYDGRISNPSASAIAENEREYGDNPERLPAYGPGYNRADFGVRRPGEVSAQRRAARLGGGETALAQMLRATNKGMPEARGTPRQTALPPTSRVTPYGGGSGQTSQPGGVRPGRRRPMPVPSFNPQPSDGGVPRGELGTLAGAQVGVGAVIGSRMQGFLRQARTRASSSEKAGAPREIEMQPKGKSSAVQPRQTNVRNRLSRQSSDFGEVTEEEVQPFLSEASGTTTAEAGGSEIAAGAVASEVGGDAAAGALFGPEGAIIGGIIGAIGAAGTALAVGMGGSSKKVKHLGGARHDPIANSSASAPTGFAY